MLENEVIKLYSVDEAAELIQRSPATIKTWICRKIELGPYFTKVGGKNMITVEAFNSYIESCMSKSK